MIVGIGTDIVTVSRIEDALQQFGSRFVARILAPEEQADFEKSSLPSAFLAKRFAMKEAAAKALGTGIRQGVQFQDFFLDYTPLGQPQIKFKGQAAAIAAQKAIRQAHVSLSDEKETAVAFVIFET